MAGKLTAASASEHLFADFFSEIKLKKISEALKHPVWVDAMQEELNQQDTLEIKSMMTGIYQAFKVVSSLASSSSVTPTLAILKIPANVKGGEGMKATLPLKNPLLTLRGETKDRKIAISISSIQPTEVLPTRAQPITTTSTHFESSQATSRINKGKGVATESDEDPSKKLVPTSTIVRLDPDEEIKVPYMINGKMCYLADK
nr:retrovirus-related Pol polyprotein from transposon TNT 1-94 [Tanacetum cinerariifolium]